MPEMKLLPSTPPPGVIENFRQGLSLPKEDLKALNAWLRKNRPLVDSLDFDEITYRAERDTHLGRNVLWPAINLVTNIGVLLENEFKLVDALADLETLGFSEEERQNFRTLMADVYFYEAPLLRKSWRALNQAIPTVTDTRVVCDLRAVFDENPGDTADEEKIKKLLALLPVVILSLDYQEESGNVKSVVVQFSETAFARFTRSLANAGLQLARITEIGQQASSGLKKQ